MKSCVACAKEDLRSRSIEGMMTGQLGIEITIQEELLKDICKFSELQGSPYT